jgi:hypothetical protein
MVYQSVLFFSKMGLNSSTSICSLKKIFRLAIVRHNGRGKRGEGTEWEWGRRGRGGKGKGQIGTGREEGEGHPRFSNRFMPLVLIVKTKI